MRLLRTEQLDLLQVHNLLDFDVHIATLRRLRDAGRVRYLGVTHYTHAGLDELERVLRRNDASTSMAAVLGGDAGNRATPAADGNRSSGWRCW